LSEQAPLARARGSGGTEAMFLIHAFEDLGYRRYEWKCNAFNGRRVGQPYSMAFALRASFGIILIPKASKSRYRVVGRARS